MHPALLPADWPAPATVRAFTTLRHGAGCSSAPFDEFNLGTRCGDDTQAVARNRADLDRLGGLPSAPHWLRQVHGTDVLRVGEHDDGAAGRGGADAPAAEPEADAATTTVPGAVLAILTADCLPVLLCSDDGGEVAAAHAGWRGLAAGVLEATVAAMQAAPGQLLAWLGPAAGPQDYEIGVEVRDAFASRDQRAVSAFVATRPEHWHVDLYALARQRLQDAGLPAERIHGGSLSTIADPQRFYSHRRDQRSGRMASLVWMEPG